MQGIQLNNGHIVIEAAISNEFFGEASHVNIVYYASRGTLLMASSNDELFKGLHKTSMVMLKLKNGMGDRSITIQEILIDNDIDPKDRELHYQADRAMKIVSIHF